MCTYVPAFQSFFRFLQHFVLVNLANSSIRVINCDSKDNIEYIFDVPIDSKLGILFQTSSFEMMTKLSSILTISLLIHNINALLLFIENIFQK